MADRREALFRAAIFSLGLGLVGAQPALAVSAHRFNPGARPMVYTRRLVRGLAGGGAIEVKRSFEVSFIEKRGSGFELVGRQIDVAVDAPAPLQALADIERNRIEQGLFPLQLDRDGMIQTKSPVSAKQATQLAVTKAMAMAETTESVSDPQLFRQFLQQVQQSAAQFMSQLPVDLFAPSTHPVVLRRELPLPGDLSGEVEVVYESAADPSTGLLTTAQRAVTTRIGDDSRTAQEAWSLKPA